MYFSRSTVFVPDEGFSCELIVSAPARARVGEWVRLSAQRRCGPWRPIGRHEIRHRQIHVPEPKTFEPEVAANVLWIVDPPGLVRFNIPTLTDIRGEPIERFIAFRQAGHYRLCGLSFAPIDVLSNIITVEVM